MMLKNLWKIVQTQRREGNFLKVGELLVRERWTAAQKGCQTIKVFLYPTSSWDTCPLCSRHIWCDATTSSTCPPAY
eukprot:1145836-Pelagomonas_calceolata.AAC.22